MIVDLEPIIFGLGEICRVNLLYSMNKIIIARVSVSCTTLNDFKTLWRLAPSPSDLDLQE